MNGNSDVQNAAKVGNTTQHDSAPLWSDRRIQAFLSTRMPERWLVGLLGLTFVLLILIRLNPELLNAIFG